MRTLFLIGLVVVAAPAVAGHRADNDKGDPNKMICRTEDVTGSRLQTKKTCMTVQQWDDLEQQQRHSVERIQTNRGHQN